LTSKVMVLLIQSIKKNKKINLSDGNHCTNKDFLNFAEIFAKK